MYYTPQGFSMYFQSEWKTMSILIRWLHQKPADQDLYCFLLFVYLGSAGQELNTLKFRIIFRTFMHTSGNV